MSESQIKTFIVIALTISLVQTFGLMADTFITWPETAIFDISDVSVINWLVNWIPGFVLLFSSVLLSSKFSLVKQAFLGAGALLVLIGTGSWFMYEHAFASQRLFSSIANVCVLIYLCLLVQQGKLKYVA